MFNHDEWNVIEQSCRELGLGDELLEKLHDKLIAKPGTRSAADPTAREVEIMRLVGVTSSDRLVHDVRNLLNEVTLLRALSEIKGQ